MTLSEWADLPDEVGGELVDGKWVEDELVSCVHEVVVVQLLYLFGPIDERGGLVLSSRFKYRVAPKRGRMADLSVFFPRSKWPGADASFSAVPPDIAVEVLSERPADARRDRLDKMIDYARFGVRWYWIVDPVARIFQIFQLDESHRYAIVVAESEGVVRVPGCRGLKLDIDKLWASVDRLSK